MFSASHGLLQKESVIDHLILDRLKLENKPSDSQDSGNILILDTRKINRRARSNRKPVKFDPVPRLDNAVPKIFDLEQEETEDFSYIKLINNLRVAGNSLSDRRYADIQNKLTEAFRVSQLRDYIKSYYNDPAYKGAKVGVSKMPKKKLTNVILSDLWNIQKSGSVSVEDFLKSDSKKLTKSDLFLLLSRNGLLIKYLSRTGCKINFDSKDLVIKFVGTEGQITSANIILSSMLKNSHTETLDLSFLMSLFKEKSVEFSPDLLSEMISVHFDVVEPDSHIYKLTALNKNQIKRAKRLLIWLVEYNLHTKNSVLLPASLKDGKLSLLPYKDDDSIAWKDRTKDLFRVSGSEILSNNELLEKQLEIFKDTNLIDSEKLEDLSESMSEIKSFLLHPKLPTTQIEPITDEASVFSQEEVDSLYENLTDTSHTSGLIGLDSDKVSEPLFTVTLGNLVFQDDSDFSGNLLPQIAINKDQLPENYIFNTNSALVNDRVLNLPLAGIPSLSVKDLNHFKINDPHAYVIQMRFQPSLYAEDVSDMDNQMKYPPVEVWLDLNQFSKPDLSTLKLLTVENENNAYISLPNKRSDLKVSCQSTGDFFNEQTTDDDDGISTIEEILNSTTQKYARYRDQPGLQTFLEKSQLDFSGTRPTSIHPQLDLRFGDKTVRYQYISVSYIRQMEFEFKGKLVQFNLIEGGSLGGRKVEVTMVEPQVSKQDFHQLLIDAVEFINKI